jgi:predicted phosphodiesterase
MQMTCAVISVLVALILMFIVMNFRFLLYPLIPSLNPVPHAMTMSLSGRTIFVSDLHLRMGRQFQFAYDLRRMIETHRAANLLFVGDLFDSPEDGLKILGNPRTSTHMRSTLGLQGLNLNLFWLLGPVHDPTDFNPEVAGIQVLGQIAMLGFESERILLYHGHDLSRIGAFGYAWSRLLSPLSLEKLWKRFARVDDATWIIFGHTHVAGLDVKARVGNCGGWQTLPLVRPTATGILFDDVKACFTLLKIDNPRERIGQSQCDLTHNEQTRR